MEKTNSFRLNQAIVGCLGVAVWIAYYSLVMPLLWNLLTRFNLVGWMNERTNSTEAFYALAATVDLIINFFFAAPIALAFVLLVRNYWRFVFAAAALGFLWNYRFVVSDPDQLHYFLTTFAISGIVISLVILPLGVLLFSKSIRGN